MTAPAMTTTPPALLRIADLTVAQLTALLDLADEMRNGPGWWTARPQDTTVAFVFDEPFPHERETFEAAVQRLGMVPVVPRPEELAAGLAGRTDAIVAATSTPARLEQIARAAAVPVVNAHTCRPLADLLTLRRRFGYLDGLRLAYLGAGNHVAHSLMEAGALAGMHVAVATPPGYEPDHEVTIGALALAAEHGGAIHVGHDPRAAVALADAVYTDAWVSTSDEPYQVDAALMHAAAAGAVFMHGLPARRGLEVTAEVIDGAASIVREQAANRVPAAQATLHMLIGNHHPPSSVDG